PNNALSVSWVNVDADLPTVSIKQWQNNNWVNLSDRQQHALNLIPNVADVAYLHLHIDSKGILYAFIVTNQDKHRNIYIQRWYQDTWELIGEPISMSPSALIGARRLT
ncbi:MAG TPA: hypothetical protein VLL52_03460, partial [Anaerolineae bacterium]|nr:hypothetical protein [Anaerolineae bacterium]